MRSHRTFWPCLLLALAIAPRAAPAQVPAAKLDHVLQRASADQGQQRVIIRVRPGYEALVRETLRVRGHQAGASHQLIGGLAALVPGAALGQLASDPRIASVSVDAVVRPSAEPQWSPGSAPPSINLLRDTLGLDGLDVTGAGVGVAVIDSGIAPSQDLLGRIAAFYDFTNGRSRPAYPSDEYGHGTHIAGLIAGSGQLSASTYRGVAPRVRLVGLKVLDEDGDGYTSDVVRAIEFVVANRAALGIDIINLSLGHPIFEPAATDPLVLAVEQAVRAGLVVVTAAGNVGLSPGTGEPGYAGILSPGNAPSAITVGATTTADTAVRSDDRVAPFSSRGPSWYDALRQAGRGGAGAPARLGGRAGEHALQSRCRRSGSSARSAEPISG